MPSDTDPRPSGSDPEDAALCLLVAELTLQDVQEMQAGLKGKEKASEAVPDNVLALQLYAEEAQHLQDIIKDVALARSIDNALGTDQSLLQDLARAEDSARQDRELAVALAQGRPLPYRPATAISLPSPPTNTGLPSSSSPPLRSVTQIPDAASIVPRQKEQKPEIRQCVICKDRIQHGPAVRAPCGHLYDVECLRELYRMASVDESLYPPRCCQQPFVFSEVQTHLSPRLSAQFAKKSVEFSTANRVYCHRAICSAFIGAATTYMSTLRCPECREVTCGRCKEPAHPSRPCALSAKEDKALLDLADKEGWKRCPGCNHLVELAHGCYHMTCRCRKQFCYVCTETWKTCLCPQWEENRLITAAEVRVQRQLPTGPPPAPAAFRQMVHREADRLRVNHDCRHRDWKLHGAAGQCENCHKYMDRYLLRCRECQMFACVRCQRNRL